MGVLVAPVHPCGVAFAMYGTPYLGCAVVVCVLKENTVRTTATVNLTISDKGYNPGVISTVLLGS